MILIKGKTIFKKMTATMTTGSRAQVMNGTAKKTSGGLVKKDLKHNKGGDIVSRKNSARAKRTESPALKAWRSSVKQAYKLPKYSGKFILLKKGSPFYKEVKKIYKAKMAKADKKTKKTTKK